MESSELELGYQGLGQDFTVKDNKRHRCYFKVWLQREARVQGMYQRGSRHLSRGPHEDRA